jgi:hypothetical protein
MFALGPGSHAITIDPIASPFGGGNAFLRVDKLAKRRCKHGGWKNFGSTFKNQGDCVSFVATGGKNPPSG